MKIKSFICKSAALLGICSTIIGASNLAYADELNNALSIETRVATKYNLLVSTDTGNTTNSVAIGADNNAHNTVSSMSQTGYPLGSYVEDSFNGKKVSSQVNFTKTATNLVMSYNSRSESVRMRITKASSVIPSITVTGSFAS